MNPSLLKTLMSQSVLARAERDGREKQDVLINLILWTDLRRAAATDSIVDAIDYSALKKRIIGLVEGSQYHLAETLADRIASLCLEQPAIQQVQVTVEKPTALRFAHSVGVEIIRSRS